jgi:signal transduction histidine kinase/CheY-like chemotaxis protein
MSDTSLSERVLVLTPHGRDAEIACRILADGGIIGAACNDVTELISEIDKGAGALIVGTEALPPKAAKKLTDHLDQQPSWSELPVLIFALPGPDKVIPAFDLLQDRHFTILDRPVGVKALISATRAALRWRRRQYDVRGLMEELENRVHERDKFLAVLGHELRNPLGAILLASQMTDENGYLAEEHVRVIERQSRHLTRLVDDLLDLSRITAGKIVLQTRAIDLREVVALTLQTLEKSIDARSLSLSMDCDRGPAHVIADPVRLEQIVSNLVTNAIKYTPPGGSIEIFCQESGDEIELHVKDNGDGISPDRLDAIFGLFTQAENAIGRSQGGMGIGLSLVRTLVALHGGNVMAKSDGVGRGSEFIVSLPAAKRVDLPLRRDRRVEPQSSPEEPRRIVLVEDNPDVRTLLQLKLRRMGHQVEAVANGESGVEAIKRFRPHLAVVDIGLPGISGYDVARRVRSEDGDGVFLVALSGFGQPEDKQKAIEAGFDEHITKPADAREIENIIRRAGRPGGAAPSTPSREV